MRTLALILLLAPRAGAIDLQGRLASDAGRPADLAGTVVWVEGGERLPHPAAPSERRVMSQMQLRFVPQVLLIRKGDRVEFPNLDDVFHNVFSPDRKNRFDLGYYRGAKRFKADLQTEVAGSTSTARTFADTGKIFVFCNLHRDMAAAIYVFDHPFYAMADADGRFSLPLPSTGTFELGIDGPLLDRRELRRVEARGDSPRLELLLKLRPAPRKVFHTRKDGSRYPEEGPPF